MSRKDFEVWAADNYPVLLVFAKWHEDGQRYTTMSSTQTFWEAWQAAAKLQREKDAEICTNQRYMVLQPMRTYSAEDLCSAQKDSAKTLAKMILAHVKK